LALIPFFYSQWKKNLKIKKKKKQEDSNDKLVDKFTLRPAALPIGDASLTHVIKLAAHSTTSPTPTAMRQSFIMTP
jgi:hypothetical protein